MTDIYFVRHAQPDLSVRDDLMRPLTPQGMKDRHLAVGWLLPKHIAHVCSSPYLRARQTVAPLADLLGLGVELLDGFRERAIGEWVADYPAFARQQWQNFDHKLPGGESLAETQARGLHALGLVLASHANQAVAIGGHGTAICTLLHYFCPSFAWPDFSTVAGRTPWLLHLRFVGTPPPPPQKGAQGARALSGRQAPRLTRKPAHILPGQATPDAPTPPAGSFHCTSIESIDLFTAELLPLLVGTC